MKYVYPAKIYAEKVGGYSVEFPDVEGAITQGETLFETLENAQDALAEMLIAFENFKAGRAEEMTNRIVEPSGIQQFTNSAEIFYSLIAVDTDKYRNFRLKNPESVHECWYNPKIKKYFTVLSADDIEVKPIAEKLVREASGVK